PTTNNQQPTTNNQQPITNIKIYQNSDRALAWLAARKQQTPHYACVLGFTETGLMEGISAAGATPGDRAYTALADAEFLAKGPQANPRYPLPPLSAGVSPAFISRAAIAQLQMPIHLLDAGLIHAPSVPVIPLNGAPARCVTTGAALPLTTVQRLFEAGTAWGEKFTRTYPQSYPILSECVVGGTTTALSVLTGLGIAAVGKVNSSHPQCNHAQKWQVVRQGLQQAQLWPMSGEVDPLVVVAAVGDPMQIAAAAIAMAVSRTTGVLLAGGTQMLAVYALMQRLGAAYHLPWQPQQVVVGTTRWVSEDSTGDTPGLARLVGDVPLLATQLDFTTSRYESLRAYEQGYVKEGVGAGGCAIAAHLHCHWTSTQFLAAIEALIDQTYFNASVERDGSN
ncbi:MAG: TIGR00303 family protein, partial [Jaaginema sp. PMC 1079.18]|nr:TIGR00303 family protein [Jaaginema sp. PMC 1080.18]MEC4849960.1 TIGR00303 family protein [Jaaginema sp. PMC 1079.18]